MAYENGGFVTEHVGFSEWLEWACIQVLCDEYGIFTHSKSTFVDSLTLVADVVADGSADRQLERLLAFGRMMALALIHRAFDNQTHRVTLVLLARLLQEELAFDELQLTFWDHPELTSLEFLDPAALDAAGMNILIDDEWVTVTAANRDALVRRKIESFLPPRFDAAVAAIRDGFTSLIPLEVLEMVITAATLRGALGGPTVTEAAPLVVDHSEAFFAALANDFAGQTATGWWLDIGGVQLLLAAADKENAESIRTLITVATNLNVEPAKEQEFAGTVGFELFGLEHKERIKGLIVSDRKAFCNIVRKESEGLLESAYEMAFAANLNYYCPNVVDSLEMREAVLAHGLLRNFSLSAAEDASGISLVVRLERAFNDSFWRLLEPAENLKMGVSSVSFIGDEGHGTGVNEDWITETIAQAFSASEGLFAAREEAPFVLEVANKAQELSYDQLTRYKAVWRLMGLAFIEGRSLGVPLPVTFLARLSGQMLSLDDIQEDHPQVYASLKLIEDMAKEEVTAAEIYVDETLVTVDNRQEAVVMAIHMLIPDSSAVSAIETAFKDVIPIDLMDGLVNAKEVQQLMVGAPEIDFTDIETLVQLDGYEDDDPQPVWLFRVVRSYAQDDRRLFL